MKSTRIKKKSISNVTHEQAQEASKTVAEKKNRLGKIEVKMNEELDNIKSRYSEDITGLKQQLVEPIAILEVYAHEQRSTWGKKKSIELLHCEVGFRMGTPKVIKHKEFTWDAVLELLKKNQNFHRFIRRKEEINKEAILALNALNEEDKNLLQQLKDECFVLIDHDENFFVDPKKEEVA